MKTLLYGALSLTLAMITFISLRAAEAIEYSSTSIDNSRPLPRASEVDINVLPNGKFITPWSYNMLPGDTIGYVAGKFSNKERTDTLYAVYLGCTYYSPNPEDDGPENLPNTYALLPNNKDVSPLYLSEYFFLNDICIDDVDRDGLDEMWIINNWWIGTWYCYNIFKPIKGKWHTLTEPVIWWAGHEEDVPLNKLVKPSSRKGYLQVIESMVINDGMDFVQMEKLARINPKLYHPKKNSYYDPTNGTKHKLPKK